MEASGSSAAAASADGGDANAEVTSGADQQALVGQLETMAQNQEQVFGELQQFLQNQAAEETEGEDDVIDLSIFDPAEPEYDPEAFAQQLQQSVQQIADQKVAPLQQELQDMRTERAAERLAAEFPEMGTKEVAEPVLQLSQQLAMQIAGGDPQMAEHIAGNPDVWRLVYMAGRAADAAAEEGSEGPPAVLESGNGAMSGAFEGDMADQLFGSSETNGRPLGFL